MDPTIKSALIQAIPNAILVLVTGWYAWQTKKQANSSAAQVEQMKETARFNTEQANSMRETVRLSAEQIEQMKEAARFSAEQVKSLQETVRLTTEQFQFTKEAAGIEHQQYVEALVAFVEGLRDIVCQKLSEEIPRQNRDYAAFYFLHESDLSELLRLSRNVGGEVTNFAAKAAISLRVMYALAQGVHRRGDSIPPTEQEQKTWERARQDSERELNEIRVRVSGTYHP
jgi:hypothetical protein